MYRYTWILQGSEIFSPKTHPKKKTGAAKSDTQTEGLGIYLHIYIYYTYMGVS